MFVSRGLVGPKCFLKMKNAKGKQVNNPALDESLLWIVRIRLDRATTYQFAQVLKPAECRNGEKWAKARVGV